MKKLFKEILETVGIFLFCAFLFTSLFYALMEEIPFWLGIIWAVGAVIGVSAPILGLYFDYKENKGRN